MKTERRWVTIVDNSQGNLDELSVVRALVGWYSGQGIELTDYASNPLDRLAEGQAVLDFAQNYISDAALDAIRSEWLAGWLEYILDLGDVEIHEDFPECYGYWEEIRNFICHNCGDTTKLQDQEGQPECIDCLVARADRLGICLGCGAIRTNEGYCSDPECAFSQG